MLTLLRLEVLKSQKYINIKKYSIGRESVPLEHDLVAIFLGLVEAGHHDVEIDGQPIAEGDLVGHGAHQLGRERLTRLVTVSSCHQSSKMGLHPPKIVDIFTFF